MCPAPLSEPSTTLGPQATADLLDWTALADEIAALLVDDGIQVPPRSVLALAGGASLFVMPASDRTVAMAKLITLTPAMRRAASPPSRAMWWCST